MILRMDPVLVFESLRLTDERRKKTSPMKVGDSMCANTDGFYDIDVVFSPYSCTFFSSLPYFRPVSRMIIFSYYWNVSTYLPIYRSPIS